MVKCTCHMQKCAVINPGIRTSAPILPRLFSREPSSPLIGLTTNRTLALSIPMPNAMVATTTWTSPLRHAFCTSMRCFGVIPAW